MASSVAMPAGGAWRSLVARLLWEQEVPSSNLGAPTIHFDRVDTQPGYRFHDQRTRRRVQMTPTLRRAPLLVFLLLGIGVFALERWLAGGIAEQRVVMVTDEQVDALRARWDAQWGRPPSDRELQGLIDEAVREEILYREALRLALDRDDPIVRRRLARKMTFMLEDNAEARMPAAPEVEDYFAAHAERYREPHRTTFRHVYLSTDRRTDPRQDATVLLHEVRAGGESGWRRAGDPFMLLREYADRTDREIVELFGGDFSAALGELAVGRWHGPVGSAHGTHLVQVVNRTTPEIPALDAIRERVAQDLIEERRREQNAAALQALRARYEVRKPVPEPLRERP